MRIEIYKDYAGGVMHIKRGVMVRLGVGESKLQNLKHRPALLGKYARPRNSGRG